MNNEERRDWRDDRRKWVFEKRAEKLRKRSGKSRVFTGLLLLLVGAVLLVQKISNPFPQWVFSWPVVLIALGFFMGLRKGFRGPGWLMFILIGGLFLAADMFPQWNLRNFTWPILIMFAGLAFILRPRRHGFAEKWMDCDDINFEKKKHAHFPNDEPVGNSSDLPLDIVSFLGGTKKIILSKDFKGGEVTSFLGGTELNLSQADINGTIVLDLTQVFGGTKLIVPSHWDIKPELVSVFGGIEDKRQLTGTVDPSKVLILKGTSVFGGIEIRSF